MELAPPVNRLAARMPEANARPLISIVVCTRDRPDSLGATLDSLAAQKYPAFELVLVDQSRGEETPQKQRVQHVGGGTQVGQHAK